MEAIGDAIEQSAGLIAVISQKYVKSTYCNDEMVMAKSSGLQIFPLLFRDMTFEALPSRMKYMLVRVRGIPLTILLWVLFLVQAAINCIPFPERKSDQQCMKKLLRNMQSIFDVLPAKSSMRHMGHSKPAKSAADELAELPMAVPELPTSVASRSAVVSVLRSHVLAEGTNKRVLAHGQGGVGESFCKPQAYMNDLIVLFQTSFRQDNVGCHHLEG